MVYLQVTLEVDAQNRTFAGEVYSRYREPFLKTITSAQSKQPLIRSEDVQVLLGFDTREHA